MAEQKNLGPAERIINTLLAYTDHAYHGRPGVVVPDAAAPVGVKWLPATWVKEKVGEVDVQVVYLVSKVAKRVTKTRLGVLTGDRVMDGGVDRGRFQEPGVFPEVAAWLYKQVHDVYQLDAEFAARWASYAFAQDHKDLKVVLAAFMLVQSRSGQPVVKDGKRLFNDVDYREVGEAMVLSDNQKLVLTPKHLIRVYEVLALPVVIALNKTAGFATGRNAHLGRWTKTVARWLSYRETNPEMLMGLVKAGMRRMVMRLAQLAHYKPSTPRFFEVLRWKQKQSPDGRRALAIGLAVKAAEDWSKLSEREVCERIVKERPSYKRLTGLVPVTVGITRAVMAAALEAGSLSDRDVIIAAPTLENLGLLQVPDVKARFERALAAANDQRAKNVARNMKSEETKAQMVTAADVVVQKAVEAVAKDVRLYAFIDCSGSMQGAIEAAIDYLSKSVQAFPLERLHVARFNTQGLEVKVPHASAEGVKAALHGLRAEGGTDYGAGVRALQHIKPLPTEDVLFWFFGDEEAYEFTDAVRRSGINPSAFVMVKVKGGMQQQPPAYGPAWACVSRTATALGIPCVYVDKTTFADAYAIPRTLQRLIAATPVNQNREVQVVQPRMTLVDVILKTPLLTRPTWATPIITKAKAPEAVL